MDQAEIESIAAVAVREYMMQRDEPLNKQQIAMEVCKKTNINGAAARIAVEAIDFYVDVSGS